MHIRFERVSFRYPGSDRFVLKDLDFEIGIGERVALVGRNGAGKTTIAKLLLGLYEPTIGRVTAGGVDIKNIQPGHWRGICAAVFQDYMRYATTLYNNVAYGEITSISDDKAVRTAASKSGADEVARLLPLGYQAELGKGVKDDAQELSTGQWQKLALARAYFRNARLLVLDEPTASLDARSEIETYLQFKKVVQGRSALFISHRLGSAKLADRIIVLNEGKIVEQGNHEELSNKPGEYAQMWNAQLS